jgi:hypothetical protein
MTFTYRQRPGPPRPDSPGPADEVLQGFVAWRSQFAKEAENDAAHIRAVARAAGVDEFCPASKPS